MEFLAPDGAATGRGPGEMRIAAKAAGAGSCEMYFNDRPVAIPWEIMNGL
jgi:hypothetical protein